MRGLLPLLLLTACSNETPGPVPGDDSDSPAASDTHANGEDTAPVLVTTGLGSLTWSGPRPRNVIFLSIDTLRRDALTRFGGTATMPALDDLAARSVILTDMTQCGNWTFPTTSCTLMGRSHVDNGFMARLLHHEPLPDGTEMLQHWLGAAGFHTVLVSSSGWLGDRANNNQGFTVERRPSLHADRLLEVAADSVVDVSEPWFVHVHVIEPHAAYAPPDNYLAGLAELDEPLWDLTEHEVHYDLLGGWPDMPADERALLEAHLRVRYDGEQSYLDDMIRDGIAAWEARGILDDALLVVWNDHGEQFWEHGDQGHAYSLHYGETDAIGLIWAEHLVPGEWTGPTESIDLAPTAMHVLGVPIPDIVSGRPVGTAPPDRPQFSTAIARNGAIQSVTSDGWRLLFHWEDGRQELYDRRQDPRETTDLFAADHPQAERLWALLRPQVETAAALTPQIEVAWPTPNDATARPLPRSCCGDSPHRR